MRKLKITELNRLSTDEYKVSDKTPLVVVLDHIRSLNNVGSVFRTADAFRMEAVYLCGITATPPHAEIHKTALGAEDTVEWHYFKQTLSAVTELKQMGYVICAVEQAESSISLEQFVPEKDKKYAVVVGHEVKGVQQEVVDICDMCIEIPQSGTKHSLNVSVATGIVLWMFFEKITLQRPSV
jgi:tRNA G18 (ribose-2'-O)-methylase SpoU